MKLSEQLDRIEVAVDSIRTTVGLENAVIEDVATGTSNKINELNTTITSQSETIIAKDGEITTLTETVAIKESEIAALNETVGEKNAEIGTLNSTIEGKDNTITTLQNQISDLEAQLPEGNITISENGTHNVATYETAIVNVPTTTEVNLGDKTITENGTYAASDDNLDGYSSVVINVEGGGASVNKGIIVDACDDEGYPTQVSIVGMTEIPEYYIVGSYEPSITQRITEIILPEGVTYLGERAFYNNTALTNMELPDTITDMGDWVFEYCPNINFTSLPSGLTRIRNGVFRECANLSLSSLPETVTEIYSYAFNGCASLALTELPNGLVDITNEAFAGCTSLAITELPVGITELNSGVFRGCSGLTSLTVLGDVTVINNSAFESCTGLIKLAFPNVTTVPLLSNIAFRYASIANGTGYIYVPDALVDSFKSASNWSTYSAQIKPISEMPTE